MEKLELTLNMLYCCLKGAIIASGETTDSPDGLNISGSGAKIRWVLKLGYANDWAVYCTKDTIIFYNDEYIAAGGDKVKMRENINNILNISDEVWKRYRH